MRVRGLTLLVGLGLVLTACGGGGADTSEIQRRADFLRDADAQVPGCDADDCRDAVAALAAQLAKVPGVMGVTRLEYVAEQSTDVAHVVGDVRVSEATSRRGCAAVRLPVARLLWASQVSPVSYAALQCFPQGATKPTDYRDLKVELDAFSVEQLQSWGPRGG